MKVKLLALFVALFMAGCGEPDLSEAEVLEAIRPYLPVAFSKLQDRNGVMYLPNEETPFTGRALEYHGNGKKSGEARYKDGKLHGPFTLWYESEQKEREQYFKDGKLHGLETMWYENGQKRTEGNWKNNKLTSAVAWKPNGEKCPVTNIDEDGNGVVVFYYEDGTEDFRVTYKDGE